MFSVVWGASAVTDGSAMGRDELSLYLCCSLPRDLSGALLDTHQDCPACLLDTE